MNLKHQVYRNRRKNSNNTMRIEQIQKSFLQNRRKSFCDLKKKIFDDKNERISKKIDEKTKIFYF